VQGDLPIEGKEDEHGSKGGKRLGQGCALCRGGTVRWEGGTPGGLARNPSRPELKKEKIIVSNTQGGKEGKKKKRGAGIKRGWGNGA